MKKKVVLMQNVKYNFESIQEYPEDGDLSYWTGDEYVQISEPVEVDFPELSGEVVIKGQINIIERQITKVKADAESAITALEGRKQELLAIGCES